MDVSVVCPQNVKKMLLKKVRWSIGRNGQLNASERSLHRRSGAGANPGYVAKKIKIEWKLLEAVRRWESEKHRSWSMPVEGSRNHVATDGSALESWAGGVRGGGQRCICFDAHSDEACRSKCVHRSSTTSQQKRTEHALVKRRRHWRCQGLGDSGYAARALLPLGHTAPLLRLRAVTRETTSRRQSTG